MTLTDYLAALRRRALALIACVIAGLAGAAVLVAQTQKQYESTATFFVNLPTTTNLANETSAIQVTTGLVASFEKLVTTRSIALTVAQNLGVPEGDISGHVSASLEAGTFFIDVRATSSDPGQARVIADATASAVVTRIPQIQGRQATPVSATIIDRAVPPNVAFQPRPSHTITLGLLFGAIIGIGLVATLEALDRSIRTVDQISAATTAPVLGVVPRRRGTSRDRLLVPEVESEPYRSLRTSVQFLDPDAPPRTLLVTSPGAGDGKTTTAANLAVALAEAGQAVILLDADLRQARTSRALGLSGQAGITSLITRQSTLDEAVFSSGLLHVLATGPLPPNPSELLGSHAMVGLLELLRSRYDMIVLDATPVLAVTDAVVVAPHCDATILVARHGQTTRASLQESARRLVAVGAAVSGVVFNGAPRSESVGYYGEYLYSRRRSGATPLRERLRAPRSPKQEETRAS